MAAFGASPQQNLNNDFPVRTLVQNLLCCSAASPPRPCSACLAGAPVQVANPPTDGITSLCFSPRANFLVATSWDNQVREPAQSARAVLAAC
jgi:WD40 repeat protein